MNEAVFFSSSTTNTRMEGVYLRASNTQHRKCAARHCARTTDCRPRAATAAWIERMGQGRPDSMTRSPYIILKPWDLEFGASLELGVWDLELYFSSFFSAAGVSVSSATISPLRASTWTSLMSL